jgi:protein-S-isoprenylcysteine O-methyltransferase Ste14
MSDLFAQQNDQPNDQANDQPTMPIAETVPIGELAPETGPNTPRPRIRSGAIVWGVLVSAAAVFLLAIAVSPANAAAFSAWTGSLGWGGAILVGVVALGAFILIMAVLSAIRTAQRRRRSVP